MSISIQAKMGFYLNTFYLIVITLFSIGCETTYQRSSANLDEPEQLNEKKASESSAPSTYVFGWGNVPLEIANPRGGTTLGTPVELAPPRALPLASVVRASNSFEKDRAAILSLSGDYKTSFHFLETLGLYSEHEPIRPYHSWATEEVRVLEDSGSFISLQHTLVMHFEMEDGSVMEPMVMKHWRQDWTYEDTDLHTYRGDSTWSRARRDPNSVSGAWSQAVWQVDDSPRYEAIGRWTHDGNRSIWTGENSWRPLPRREYSVRDDYGVMEGFHRIVITPTGWIHEQNNWKRVEGNLVEVPEYRGHELGIDRYERITSPSLSKSDNYWEKTGVYWSEVRKVWKEVFAERERFSLKSKVEGRSQFEFHFEYVGRLEAGETYDPKAGSQFARDTIQSFLTDSRVSSRY